MIGLLLTVLVVGFAGSFHCTSMCGGLVAFATAGSARSFRARLGAIASYNGTRGFGYVVLGGAAGALGSALDGVFLRVGVSRIAGAVAGIVMLAWGILKALEAVGRLPRSPSPTGIHVPLGNLIRRVREKPPAVRASIVGGCTAALPCGFLHAALIVAGGTGSAPRGALVAMAFWLGTVPAVAGLAFGVDLLTHGLKRRASLLGAVALVVFGFSSLLGRWSPASLFPAHAPHVERSAHVR
jgi:sulfite exporter TauE/SafE